MARRLADLIEGYRWLWSAQRRWHPGSRWLATVRFVIRVLADIMRLLIPPLRAVNRLRVKHLALASLVLAAALVFDVQRRGDSGFEAGVVTWADTTGGFEVVFPAEWVAAHAAGDDQRPAMDGSTHRRPAGGTLMRRYITARAYDLGVMPPGITTRNLAALASGIRAPGETIVRPERAGRGAYVTLYRSGNADEGSNAAVFFRGRDGHGFLLEITGHRDDEALLVGDAFAIANSLRQEQLVLNDLAISLAQSFSVPSRALEAARAMKVNYPMTTMAVGPLPPPAQVRRMVEPIVVNANLFLDTATGGASDDECRARAVLLFSEGLPALPEVFLGPIEFRMTCQTSTVAIGPDRQGPALLLRQFDRAGEMIYEESALLDVLFTVMRGR